MLDRQSSEPRVDRGTVIAEARSPTRASPRPSRALSNRAVARSVVRERPAGVPRAPIPEPRSPAMAARGGPLPSDVRRPLEEAFGRSLDHVRVHTDGEAAESARRLRATAYTVGSDVFLGREARQAPASARLQVLAHELTHVVQAGNRSGSAPRIVSEPGDPAEREADRVSRALMGVTAEPAVLPVSARPAAVIHRQPVPPAGPVPAPAAAPGPAPAPGPTAAAGPAVAGPQPSPLSPEAAQQMAYSATVLKRVGQLPQEDLNRLGQAIGHTPVYTAMLKRDAKRAELGEARKVLTDLEGRAAAQQFPSGGESPPGGAPVSKADLDAATGKIDTLTKELEGQDRDLQALLKPLGVTEEKVRDLIEKQFPELWVRRGKQVARALLAENKDLVLSETSRYGMSSPQSLASVRRAAAKLLQMRNDLVRAQTELMQIQPTAGQNPADPYGDVAAGVAPKQGEVNRLKEDHDKALASYTTEFPVFGIGFDDAQLGRMAKGSDEDLAKMLAGQLADMLGHIKDTEANIDSDKLRVWNLPLVRSLTFKSLNVDEASVLGDAVRKHTKGIESEEQALKEGLMVVAITATVVASIATAGGAALVAAAATGVSAGITLASLGAGVTSYAAESAAGKVSLIPQFKDISEKEPELLPIIMDLFSLAMDVHSVVAAARTLSLAEKALAETGDLARYTATVKGIPKLPPAAGEKYVAQATQKAATRQATRTVLTKVGDAAKAEVMAGGVTADIIQREIDMLANRGFGKMLDRLRGSNRFFVVAEVSEEELNRVYKLAYGEQKGGILARKAVNDGMVGVNGFYDPAMGQQILIVKGSQESAQIYTVHELVHRLQDLWGMELLSYKAEWQAYFMQRDYAQKLIHELGAAHVPEDVVYWAGRTDAELEAHILTVHPTYSKPYNFDQSGAIQEIWANLKNQK